MREVQLVAYRAFSDVAGKGAFFLVTVLAARLLSARGFGIFSLGTTLGWLAAVVSDFGIQLHLAREVARRPAESRVLLGSWLRARAWTSAAVFAVVILGLGVSGFGGPYAPALLLFVLVYLANGLVEFLYYFYRGLSRSDIESTLTLAQRFGMLALAAAALAWRPEATTLAVAMLVPAVVTLAYGLRLASAMAGGRNRNGGYGGNGNRERGGNGNGEHGGNGLTTEQRSNGEQKRMFFSVSPLLRVYPFSPRPPLPLSPRSPFPLPPSPPFLFTHFARDVMPIGLGIVLSAMYFRIDVFLIQWWTGTEAVAQYNAVFRLVEALRLFPAAVLAVALPSLCRATNLRPLVFVSTWVTGFALAVSIGLGAVAGWVVPFVYGAAFAEAVPAFRILLASFPLMSLNYALTHQLVGWNGHRAYAALAGTALVFNVAINARLIPTMSIAGAAWSTLWTEAVLTVGAIAALRMATARPSAEPLPAPVTS